MLIRRGQPSRTHCTRWRRTTRAAHGRRLLATAGGDVRQRLRRSRPPAATQGPEVIAPGLLLAAAAAIVGAPRGEGQGAGRCSQAHRRRAAWSGGGRLHRQGEGTFTGACKDTTTITRRPNDEYLRGP